MKHFSLVLIIGCAAVAGCSADRNGELTIGDDRVSPTIAGAEPSTDLLGGTPGVVSLTREEWEPVVFEVPLDGTETGEDHGLHAKVDWNEETARRMGAYPTPEEAVDVEFDGDAEVWHGIASPFVGAFEIVLMPVRFLTGEAYATRESPRGAYERSAHGAARAEVAGEGMETEE